MSPGAGDFTVACLFKTGALQYSVIARWNTGGAPGTNCWFLGQNGDSGAFSVECGSSTFSASIAGAGMPDGQWFMLVGRRRGTTIYVDKFAADGTHSSASTTNAGITTINDVPARKLKLGEIDASFAYNSTAKYLFAATWRRALLDAELPLLFANVWQAFAPANAPVFYLLPGSGASYTDSLTDSAAATDSATTVLAALGAVTDSGALTDTSSSLLVGIDALSDSGALTDTANAGNVITQALTDSGALTDSASSVLSASDSLTDASAATDTAAGTAVMAEALSDSAAATDTAAGAVGGFDEAISDAGAATDEFSVSVIARESITDTATATDSLANTAVLADLLADLAAGSDIVAPGVVATHALADSAAVADSATGTIGAQSFTDSLADTLTATDAFTGELSAFGVRGGSARGGGAVRVRADTAARVRGGGSSRVRRV